MNIHRELVFLRLCNLVHEPTGPFSDLGPVADRQANDAGTVSGLAQGGDEPAARPTDLDHLRRQEDRRDPLLWAKTPPSPARPLRPDP